MTNKNIQYISTAKFNSFDQQQAWSQLSYSWTDKTADLCNSNKI